MKRKLLAFTAHQSRHGAYPGAGYCARDWRGRGAKGVDGKLKRIDERAILAKILRRRFGAFRAMAD